MSFQETKQKFIYFLYERGEYIRRINNEEYQTRCPFCGDSSHTLNTGHLYINIDADSPYNMPYICFKCQTSGIVNPELLDMMGNDDQDLRNAIHTLNKKGKNKKSFDKENKFMYFERVIPEEIRYPNKLNYIKKRLMIDFNENDISKMKVITSLYDFLIENNIKSSPFKKDIRTMLERDYIGFLSSGNSHILFRDITEKHKYKWIKYPIEPESKKNRVFYSFSDPIDIFTDKDITINLSEGVMDTLGIAYHFGYNSENVINIAACGQNYNTNIKHLIDMGVFGSNVTLNIYLDNDEMYNKDAKKRKPLTYLKEYLPLFKSINTFINLKAKDYGIPKEDIILKKYERE